jgi:uncharacterized repeat protein (TIGR01451 family)
MKNLFRSLSLALALTVIGGAVRAHAQQAPAPEVQALTVTATNRTAAAEAERGTPRSDVNIRGGDVVQYRLSFTNVNPRAVRQVVLSNPIPAGFRLVPGSLSATRDDARAEFSADGGRSFSAQPMEEVVVDGRRVRRPIPTDRYTHVRWTVEGMIAPNQTVHADFHTRLAAPRANMSSVQVATPITR